MMERTEKREQRTEISGEAIRVIFLGTPDFAVTSLEALVNKSLIRANGRVVVVGVITRPDRPIGRTQTLIPPPVKVFAVEHGIPVLQPEKLRDVATIQTIRDLKPDLMVVVVYSRIIPQEILDIPRYGTINVHPSLLPKHRGPSPTKAAIAAGDTETGVSIMLLDAEMDHGPILAQEKIPISADETDETLFAKLAPLGAQLLVQTIPQWVAGEIKPQAQDHEKATYSKILTRDDGRINWQEPAEVIERKIRAYTPWPGTWTSAKIKDLRFKIKVLKARVVEPKSYNLNPTTISGTVFKTPAGFAVQCGPSLSPSPLRGEGWGEGGTALEILSLQLEGKKPMSAADFLRGYPDIVGAQLT